MPAGDVSQPAEASILESHCVLYGAPRTAARMAGMARGSVATSM
jgi:hypothetical protein